MTASFCSVSHFEGLVAVVTGASSGIGRQVARNLLDLGANVHLVCRNKTRGEKAVADLLCGMSAGGAELHIADVSSKDSISNLSERLGRRVSKVDVLVNNAGIYPAERILTAEGVEQTWATNVLGYHRMIDGFRSLLSESSFSRVVNVTSAVAGGLCMSDVQFEHRRFRPYLAYCQSKQANRLLSWAWARRLRSDGIGIHAVNPGPVNTGLARHQRGLWGVALRCAFDVLHADVVNGSRLLTFVATTDALAGLSGLYFSRGKPRRCRFRSSTLEEDLFRICESGR